MVSQGNRKKKKTSIGEEENITQYNVIPKGALKEMGEWMQSPLDAKPMKEEDSIMNIAKMVSLGQLSATIIHELKQPLNSMSVGISTLELLLKEKEYDKKAVTKVLHSMQNQVLQSSNLIMTLSDFNRGQIIGRDYLNIKEIIQSVFVIIEKELQKVGIMPEVQIEKNLPPIYGEKIKLQQLFINLLLNAKDAIEEKRERMNMEDLGKIFIEISHEKKAKEVYIQIRDNGMGIKEKEQEKIFQPFFSTKPKGKGTGLGMVIIKKVIEQHEGRIEFDSIYEVGTSFKIWLPVKEC